MYPSPAARKKDKDGIVVRVIEYTLNDPGRPSKEKVHRLLTTLLDAEADPAEELIVLYHQRWEEEMAIRAIKQGLGVKMLTCKTPAMVEAELWAHLLGYNLTRCVMAQAALEGGCARGS